LNSSRISGSGFVNHAVGLSNMIEFAPRQKLLGKPNTCSATWLRIRLVEIGAT
jgi:hypothetical protein